MEMRWWQEAEEEQEMRWREEEQEEEEEGEEEEDVRVADEKGREVHTLGNEVVSPSLLES